MLILKSRPQRSVNKEHKYILRVGEPGNYLYYYGDETLSQLQALDNHAEMRARNRSREGQSDYQQFRNEVRRRIDQLQVEKRGKNLTTSAIAVSPPLPNGIRLKLYPDDTPGMMKRLYNAAIQELAREKEHPEAAYRESIRNGFDAFIRQIAKHAISQGFVLVPPKSPGGSFSFAVREQPAAAVVPFPGSFELMTMTTNELAGLFNRVVQEKKAAVAEAARTPLAVNEGRSRPINDAVNDEERRKLVNKVVDLDRKLQKLHDEIQQRNLWFVHNSREGGIKLETRPAGSTTSLFNRNLFDAYLDAKINLDHVLGITSSSAVVGNLRKEVNRLAEELKKRNITFPTASDIRERRIARGLTSGDSSLPSATERELLGSVTSPPQKVARHKWQARGGAPGEWFYYYGTESLDKLKTLKTQVQARINFLFENRPMYNGKDVKASDKYMKALEKYHAKMDNLATFKRFLEERIQDKEMAQAKPAPPAHAASLEESVRAGKYSVDKVATEGIHGVKFVTFADGTKGVARDYIAWGDTFTYRLAQAIGCNRIPETWTDTKNRANYQRFVSGKMAEKFWDSWGNKKGTKTILNAVKSDQGRLLGICDYLTGNSDRHLQNWFVDPKTELPWGLDHEFSFEGGWTQSPFAAYWFDKPGTPEELKRIADAVDKLSSDPQFKASFGDRQVKEIRRRAQYMVDNGKMDPSDVEWRFSASGFLKDGVSAGGTPLEKKYQGGNW